MGNDNTFIGAIIMVHGDNSGLVLPPRIAPVQAVVIPIQQKKEGVLDNAYKLQAQLKAAGIRVKTDDTDKSPGFKFAEQEMRGIPVRIECGPKDIENGQAVICVVIQERNILLHLMSLWRKYRKSWKQSRKICWSVHVSTEIPILMLLQTMKNSKILLLTNQVS